MNRRTGFLTLGALVAFAAAAPAAGGTERVAPRLAEPEVAAPGWTAWHGCWRPVGEDAQAATVVCMLPGAEATAVRIVTYVDGAVNAEAALNADGVARPVEQGGCVGQETARWSADGRRVFVRSEFDCGGLGRVSTGVLAMVAENEWVDVQALTVAGQHASRSIRYRAVSADELPAGVAAQLPQDMRLAQETARLGMSLPLSVEAVIEASREIAPPAVEGLLAARQHGYAMDRSLITRLQREQVAASTIDMMVALSYPQRFAIRDRRFIEDAAQAPTAPPAGYAAERGRRADECYDPFFMRPAYGAECTALSSRYSRYGYGYGYGYGYNRYGYSPWGYDPFGWHYGRDPVVVIVEPGRGESQRGEVVRGRGYVNPGSSSGRSAQPREPASAVSTRPASTAAPAAGASSGTGSSSGDSGSSTGRTAVPRNGGGGGQNDGGQEERE